jgi:predicted HTH domain antitoxin
LTFGQAAELVKLNKANFQFLLGKNRIPVNYDVLELIEDIDTIKKNEINATIELANEK